MMTREEARIELQAMKDTFEEYEPGGSRCQMALNVALTALRPVSREQVEKVWRGEWVKCKHADYYVCNKCSTVSKTGEDEFCKSCGAPMTDEAVEMVVRRLEELHGET